MIVIYALAAYLIVSAVLTGPIAILGSRLVHWRPLDLLAFVLPFATWLALMYFGFHQSPKYWTNVIAEPMYIGFAVPIAAILRLIVNDRISESVCSASLIALLCLLAAALALLMPPLPE